MDNVIEHNVESRKEWAAPELKKVDIEQITAAGLLNNYDGGGLSS
jgi:hypothetical protein